MKCPQHSRCSKVGSLFISECGLLRNHLALIKMKAGHNWHLGEMAVYHYSNIRRGLISGLQFMQKIFPVKMHFLTLRSYNSKFNYVSGH